MSAFSAALRAALVAAFFSLATATSPPLPINSPNVVRAFSCVGNIFSDALSTTSIPAPNAPPIDLLLQPKSLRGLVGAFTIPLAPAIAFIPLVPPIILRLLALYMLLTVVPAILVPADIVLCVADNSLAFSSSFCLWNISLSVRLLFAISS